MKVAQTNFFGDQNIGMLAKSTDNFCLLGNLFTEKNENSVEKYLGVPVVGCSISNTEFVGLFCAANSNGVILPKIILTKELQNLKNKLKKFDLNLYVAKSKFTSVGNLILCNDRGAVVSRLLPAGEKKSIEDSLGVEAGYGTVAGLATVGSSAVATNRGCLVHRDAGENEIKNIEDVLKVKSDIGTANFGSPFVGSCIVANSNGALVGENTTGPEIVRLQEALGLL